LFRHAVENIEKFIPTAPRPTDRLLQAAGRQSSAPGTNRSAPNWNCQTRYRFLEDREETLEAGKDKSLAVTLQDAAVEQFYFAPDTPEFRDYIAGLKKAGGPSSRFL
jgi:hypothetical protein